MNVDENNNIERIIISHIQNSNNTLNVLNNTVNLLNIQQNNFRHLIRLLEVNRSDNSEILNYPVTLSFNEINFPSDISENRTTVVQNILNMLENNRQSESPVDISAVCTSRPYSDIIHPTHNMCPISLELFDTNDVILQINVCGHIFKDNALRQWFSRSSLCPICRRNVNTVN